MPKIADLGAAVARIEALDTVAAQRREKELRNLTQRLPFVPETREGRTDIYSFASLAALRLTQVAQDVGVARPVLAKLVTALHEMDRTARLRSGMQARVIDRLVARAKAGERFVVSIDLSADGLVTVRPASVATVETNAVFRSAGFPEPIASIVIRSDDLIRALLAELGGE
jgi:hypothetical protein